MFMFRAKWAVLGLLAMFSVALVGGNFAAAEGNSSSDNSASKPADGLKAQVKDILQLRCARCHRNYQKYMDRVDPKAGKKNRLYSYCSTPHPKRNKKALCTPDEIKTVGDWLESLAKPASQPASEPAEK